MYDQQYDFFPYTVDFYLSELKMVIEADGKHGHLQKRDAKRDINLAEHDEVLNILHVRDATKEKIKETLWLALNKLSDNEAN